MIILGTIREFIDFNVAEKPTCYASGLFIFIKYLLQV